MCAEEVAMAWLLSVDGGGALGIGPAAYLKDAEIVMDRVQPQAYAGTSVGALLVALAASGRSWDAIYDIFRIECPRIFGTPPLGWRLNPRRPKYDGVALEAACKRYLGNMRLTDVDMPFFLTSFDFQRGRPKVWDHTDAVPMWYAVLCSTAAPTYFPIVEGRYGDGGLIANNPAMVGLAGCVGKARWALDQTYCLSLGTNGYAWVAPQVVKRSVLGWVRPLLETFMSGNEELATFQVGAMIGSRMVRVEPTLRHDIALDDVTAALGGYADIWHRLWTAGAKDMTAWLWDRRREG